MPKPCAQCQTMNDDAAPSCYACGAAFYAPVQTQQNNTSPPPPQQYSQPAVPAQPYGQPQDGYRQPQDGFSQLEDGYRQPSAPVKNKKKTVRTMLIVAGAIAVVVVAALFILIPRLSAGIADPDSFFNALESGVYGYEMRHVMDSGEKIFEENGFVYSDGSRIVLAYYDSEGKAVDYRLVYDYGTNEGWEVSDPYEEYMKSVYNLFYFHGVPDFRSGKSELRKGTTDCNGEKLEFIDYAIGDEEVRVFMKDSSVYAMQIKYMTYKYTYYILKFYSSPPTAEYFTIPDHYVEVFM